MINKTSLLKLFCVSYIICGACTPSSLPEPQNGDVIFHTSQSRQSGFIQAITDSPLSHVGIIYIKDGKTMVLEAVNPVKITPLQSWIKRGSDQKYILMRPRVALTDSDLKKMYTYGLKNLGKPYDMRFEWNDKRMYCSELVYKIYLAAGIELCKPRLFTDYDLSSEQAIKEITKRYGLESLNALETVVSPADLRSSHKLMVVIDTY